MIRVTVWNEYKHERELEAIKAVYPQGIHACIREFLEKEEEFSQEVACRVQRHVPGGMGLIALHSAHFSKIMKGLPTRRPLCWNL